MWRWLNHELIVDALEDIEGPTRTDILDALDALIAAPFDPVNVDTQLLRVARTGHEHRIAWLPGGLFMTYRPIYNGPPPYAGNHVVVMSMDRLDALLDDL